MILADTFFSAFRAPHFLQSTFPFLTLLAIFSEIVVYKIRLKSFSWRKIGICTLFANLASWLLSITLIGLLLPILPTGLLPGLEYFSEEYRPSYNYLLTISFIIAFLLSVGVEGIYLLSVLKIRKPEHYWVTIFIAHLMSYSVMLVFGLGRIFLM